jgi:hypothetical protein
MKSWKKNPATGKSLEGALLWRTSRIEREHDGAARMDQMPEWRCFEWGALSAKMKPQASEQEKKNR